MDSKYEDGEIAQNSLDKNKKMILKLEHECKLCDYKIKKYWSTKVKTERAKRFFEIHKKSHKKL